LLAAGRSPLGSSGEVAIWNRHIDVECTLTADRSRLTALGST